MPDDNQASETRPTAADVRRRAVDGVVTIVFREGLIRVLGLMGNLVLARLLTTTDYGEIAFGTTLVAFGSFFADGGIAAGLIGRKDEPTRLELRAMLGFNVSITLLAAVAIAAVCLPLGGAGALAALMGVSLPLSAIRVPSAVVLERQMSYRAFALADTGQILGYNILAVSLVVAGFGVWGVALATAIQALLGSVLLTTLGPLPWFLPIFSFRIVKPLLSFGVRFQAVNVLNTLRYQGLNVVTAAIGGLSVLGIWSFTQRILQGIFLLLNALWRVSYPALARLIDTGEAVQPALERALELGSTMVGFLAVALGGSAPALIPTLFGARWVAAAGVLAWSAGGLVVGGAISTAAVGYFYATRRPHIPMIAVAVHTLVWFAVSVPLIASSGAEALGIGSLVGAAADALILGAILRQDGVRVRQHCCMQMVVTFAAGAVAWWIATSFAASIGSMVASLAAGEVVYVIGLLLVRRDALRDVVRLGLRAVARVPWQARGAPQVVNG